MGFFKDFARDRDPIQPGIDTSKGPIYYSGAIIIGTLLDEMERQDKSVGLATLCIASGMGAATIIERV